VERVAELMNQHVSDELRGKEQELCVQANASSAPSARCVAPPACSLTANRHPRRLEPHTRRQLTDLPREEISRPVHQPRPERWTPLPRIVHGTGHRKDSVPFRYQDAIPIPFAPCHNENLVCGAKLNRLGAIVRISLKRAATFDLSDRPLNPRLMITHKLRHSTPIELNRNHDLDAVARRNTEANALGSLALTDGVFDVQEAPFSVSSERPERSDERSYALGFRSADYGAHKKRAKNAQISVGPSMSRFFPSVTAWIAAGSRSRPGSACPPPATS